jgi:hypothetical protein
MPEAAKPPSEMDQVRDRLAREAEIIDSVMQARKDQENRNSGRPAKQSEVAARGMNFQKLKKGSSIMVMGLIVLIGVLAVSLYAQYRKYHPRSGMDLSRTSLGPGFNSEGMPVGFNPYFDLSGQVTSNGQQVPVAQPTQPGQPVPVTQP